MKTPIDGPDLASGAGPAVEQVLMFRARDGSMHDSDDKARHHNGIKALHARLVSDIDSKLNVIEIRQLIIGKLTDWYNVYLEARNAK